MKKIRQAGYSAGGTWDFGLQTEIGSENLFATRRQDTFEKNKTGRLQRRRYVGFWPTNGNRF
ncbi:hypothetical protein FHN39_07850 [Salmonella enterica]|nr:hypothetical protein [Salmonella enterica]